jgi:hypothetical protein
MIEPVSRTLRAWQLSQGVQELRNSDRADKAILQRLHRAWGNEAYSADMTYVCQVAQLVMAARGPILECGSGLTTIVAAVLAERRGLDVWSLEQDADWLALVQQALDKFGITNAKVIHAPLKRYEDYIWYDLSAVAMPASFDLVVCDGPAVFDHWGDAHLAWRYGVLPVLKARNINVGQILLDDANEPRAPLLLRRWADEFGFGFRLLSSADGDCALVRPVA